MPKFVDGHVDLETTKDAEKSAERLPGDDSSVGETSNAVSASRAIFDKIPPGRLQSAWALEWFALQYAEGIEMLDEQESLGKEWSALQYAEGREMLDEQESLGKEWSALQIVEHLDFLKRQKQESKSASSEDSEPKSAVEKKLSKE